MTHSSTEIFYGISANEHDASLAVIQGSEILFASHTERFSRIKNDKHLNFEIIKEALKYGEPDHIVWYEKPFQKRLRKFFNGQIKSSFRKDGKSYLKSYGLTAPVHYVDHHSSHAAAGFFTSPFAYAAILVVDAIGEWATTSVWVGNNNDLKCIYKQNYPNSLGLLYSAFTQRCGFKPNEEEYIVMGLAALGKPIYKDIIKEDFLALSASHELILKENVHRGIKWWRPELTDVENIAASIQAVLEEYLINLTRWVSTTTDIPYLVLAGGVALNCVANSKISDRRFFDDIWIMPNPGDAGSSIGAVAAYKKEKLNWKSPYLGTNIDRTFDMDGALNDLLQGKPIGVANGRAEFGPRALGNRSLLCDPRGANNKNIVNLIKNRELFRPFAPVIMEEYVDEYFEMPVFSSPYMQFVGTVLRPDLFPAISHVDNTARVQTVNFHQNALLYSILEKFYEETDCPMLLNTSLNIKGQPLVNTWKDAVQFGELHNVNVY